MCVYGEGCGCVCVWGGVGMCVWGWGRGVDVCVYGEGGGWGCVCVYGGVGRVGELVMSLLHVYAIGYLVVRLFAVLLMSIVPADCVLAGLHAVVSEHAW